jgi:hypothetical protein
MLSELKSFQANSRYSLEELLSLSAYGRALEDECTALSVEPPGWLPEQNKAVRREIRAKTADALEQRLKELRSRREALKTPDEKRKSIEDEISQLEKLRAQT